MYAPSKANVNLTPRNLILCTFMTLAFSPAAFAQQAEPMAELPPMARTSGPVNNALISAKGAAKQCSCSATKRKYNAKPTASVLALWEAAKQGREQEFLRLLPKITHLDDYAPEGHPILQVLLRPRISPDKETGADLSPQRSAELLDAHKATLDSTTHMIDAAIKHGASVNDITDQENYPPLHLATVFGTPVIVKMLLDAGANPEQAESWDHKTALEFILDPGRFVHQSELPPLVTKQQRSEMILHMLKAGAKRPYIELDEQMKASGIMRPAADYLAWEELVSMTDGAPVLRAMLDAGTSPAFSRPDEDGSDNNPLSVAALTGNAGAVEFLMTLVPPTGQGGNDATPPWSMALDAANAAAAAGHMALAKSLLAPGMPFAQRGPWDLNGKWFGLAHYQIAEGTLMHFAVRARDAALVRQLVVMGAAVDAVDADSHLATPLVEATAANHGDMVALLLELGANPLSAASVNESALLAAIKSGQFEQIKMMLSNMGPEQRAALAEASGVIADDWANAPGLDTAQRFEVLKRLLDGAGFDAKRVTAGQLGSVIMTSNERLARALIEAGAAVELDSDAFSQHSPLTIAVDAGKAAIVDLLLAHGASPTRADASGWLPMQRAVAAGDVAIIERLIAAGAPIDFPPARFGSAIDLAVATGSLPLVDKVSALSGRSLAQVCLATPESAYQLLHATEAYFDGLRARGLRLTAPCAGQPGSLPMLYEALLQPSDIPLIGAPATLIARRLAGIDGSGGAAVRIGEKALSPLHSAIEAHRSDVVAILLASGAKADRHATWAALEANDPLVLRLLLAHGAALSEPAPDGLPMSDRIQCSTSAAFRASAGIAQLPAIACPATKAMSPKEKLLARKVTGTYYLEGGNEVGSIIRLGADGKFRYMLSYGAVDQEAKGSWRITGKQVTLSSPPGFAGSPFRIESVSRDPDSRGIAIRIQLDGKAVRGADVFVADGTQSQSYEPTSADGYWQLAPTGAVAMIALRHERVAGGRWFMIELPKDGAAGSNRYDIVLDPHFAELDNAFNVSLRIDGNALVAQGETGGRRYLRK